MERYFKASSADDGTKVNVIKQNRDKYSVSAMYDVLQIARSIFYYDAKSKQQEDDITKPIIEIFEKNQEKLKLSFMNVDLSYLGDELVAS
ncbi:hypothetical protein NDS46_23420 [Paenibacillus thiaminolyticus]|nr:hypothetical protein [Paenibacillus thiaminolyticus]WCF07253.1 hypothetical protein NDS46_23420 [Paenibacillus thiaminolyticus]